MTLDNYLKRNNLENEVKYMLYLKNCVAFVGLHETLSAKKIKFKRQ